jgi:hypothetical protein
VLNPAATAPMHKVRAQEWRLEGMDHLIDAEVERFISDVEEYVRRWSVVDALVSERGGSTNERSFG